MAKNLREAQPKLIQDVENKQEPDAAINSFLKIDDSAADLTKKDTRMTFRVNSKIYNQFSEINQKIGSNNSVVINMFMADYIRKNKDLLD